ncbi:MAG: hypothetical protein AABZ39_05035 [Spirochaetota bacterium]
MRIKLVAAITAMVFVFGCINGPGDRLNVFDPHSEQNPQFYSGYPKSATVVFRGAICVTLKLESPAMVYAVAVPVAAPAPSFAEVTNGRGSSYTMPLGSGQKWMPISDKEYVIAVAGTNVLTNTTAIYVSAMNPSYPDKATNVTRVLITSADIAVEASPAFWLDAMDTDRSIRTNTAGVVLFWADKSVNNPPTGERCATNNIIARCPRYLKNAMYEKPAVWFDGIDDTLYNTTYPAAMNNYTFFMVVQSLQRGAVSARLCWVRNSGNCIIVPYLGAALSPIGDQWRWYAAFPFWAYIPITTSGGANYPGIIAMSADANVSTLKSFFNGQFISSDSPHPQWFTSAGFYLGGDNASPPSYPLSCIISEVIYFAATLTDLERYNVERYLKSKWDIP